MGQLPKLEEALSRFDSAMQELEAAMFDARNASAQDASTQGEAQALREDRARLASELEEVRANADKLLDKNQQATQKIASAMSRINSVLGE